MNGHLFRRLGMSSETFEVELERVRAHLNAGRFEEALVEADDLSRRYPGVPDPHVCRGLACAALERYEEEVSAYEAAIALAPEHVDAWMNLGVAHLSAARAGPAREAFQEVMKFRPKNIQARLHLAQAYLIEESLQDAAQILDEVTREHPNQGEA